MREGWMGSGGMKGTVFPVLANEMNRKIRPAAANKQGNQEQGLLLCSDDRMPSPSHEQEPVKLLKISLLFIKIYHLSYNLVTSW